MAIILDLNRVECVGGDIHEDALRSRIQSIVDKFFDDRTGINEDLSGTDLSRCCWWEGGDAGYRGDVNAFRHASTSDDEFTNLSSVERTKSSETDGLIGSRVSASIVPTSSTEVALDVERAPRDSPGALYVPSFHSTLEHVL
jgi:hypothetical protein